MRRADWLALPPLSIKYPARNVTAMAGRPANADAGASVEREDFRAMAELAGRPVRIRTG